jgi:hypothetical protein
MACCFFHPPAIPLQDEGGNNTSCGLKIFYFLISDLGELGQIFAPAKSAFTPSMALREECFVVSSSPCLLTQ